VPNSDELILCNEDFEREYNDHNGTLRSFLVYRWWDLTRRDRFVACRPSSCNLLQIEALRSGIAHSHRCGHTTQTTPRQFAWRSRVRPLSSWHQVFSTTGSAVSSSGVARWVLR
jgi:hypothetical protein